MEHQLAKLIVDDTLAIIRLDNHGTRNALSQAMIEHIGAALKSCDHRNIRAVYITGTGPAFCSGADVNALVEQLETGGPERLSTYIRSLADSLHNEVIIPIRTLDKPVIAAVNGVAAGAGFSLALACDLRIASSSARFLMAYGNIGATADGGSTYLLPRLVGMGKAIELYTASQPVGAEYARELGLVEQVVPSDNFERHSLEIAHKLAKNPTVAFGKVKQLLNNSWGQNLESQLKDETTAIGDIAHSTDFQEGIKAFNQKRMPWFQGM
ncbi:MAG: hypothetical protein CL886_00980 [Dehalococcoidia bacterium]|nr:hypothetical protein [Dehalococcoidia bacterium]|tara:strand:- start:7566 stop:8369 length:804 start_codon:yes stop_codon:yes gene_type:complete